MLNKKALASTAGLGNVWDVSYASWEGSLPYVKVQAQSTNPSGIHFKDDGTKMYILDGGTDTIYQYSLSTAWNLSTASYDSKSFVVGGQEASPNDIFFKSDGTKFYIIGTTGDKVYQYSMSTAWDISTASYDSKSVSVAEDTLPIGLYFKPDGTKFYTVGTSTDEVREYTMSTAWDVSTATYSTNTFNVGTQETLPNALFFKNDGTKMYIVGTGSDRIYQYSLSTAWDITTASYDSKNISITAQEPFPTALFFKDDGTAAFYVGTNNDTVFKLTMSTAWDISTASYSYGPDSFSILGQEAAVAGGFFKPDGTKMYILGATGDRVWQYSLSTAWKVDTASYDSVSFSISSQSGNPTGIYFKPDGTKFYMVENTNDRVYQYSLSTAWDMSTASYDSVLFGVGSQDGAPLDLFFKDDGTKLYILGSTNDRVFQYSLSTAWDISTASYDSVSFSFGAQEGGPRGLFFKDDGTKFYIIGSTNYTVYQYSLSTAWDMSTASYDSKSFSLEKYVTTPEFISFKSNGTKMYIGCSQFDDVIEYQVG